MKKSIISGIFVLLIISTLGYFIYDAKMQRSSFFLVDNNIEKIVLLNKDFDLYLKTTLSYDNFDIIQNKINAFKYELEDINNNKILQNIQNQKLEYALKELESSMQIKFNMINRVKSYRAILNNSFRIIQRIKHKGIPSNIDNLYTIILTVDKNPELNLVEELKKIDKLMPLYTKRYNKFFLKHAHTILKYQLKFTQVGIELDQLNINTKLKVLHNLYEQYSQKSFQKAQAAIAILFILLVITITLYLIYEYKLTLSNKALFRFRKTVENSDNIVVITDENEIIKYVNDTFTKTTGYTLDEVKGKKPNILKSGKQTQEFYNELHKTIHSGNKWSGEFININKFGELLYEKASITPVLDDNSEIKEFISIKLDITSETLMEKKLHENEKLLTQQSKMAAMGEMLENIAHQWRQPLSLISTASSGLQLQKELNMITTNEEDILVLSKIHDTAQYLSETINDFRDFFKPNKTKILFNVKDIYYKTLKLVNSKFNVLEIKVIENLNDVELTNLDGEVVQVIMNLLNNAMDILETKENQQRLIFVDIYQEYENAIVIIKDNGGGIPIDIIDRIFEPYFTTKYKSQGTGIGLYMSQEMVSKHIGGTLLVKNVTYTYDDIDYVGAEFTISIPI